MEHNEMNAMTGIIFVITHENFSTCVTEYKAECKFIPAQTMETWKGCHVHSSTYSQTRH